MIHSQARFPLHLLKASDVERLSFFRDGFVLRHPRLNSLFNEIRSHVDWPGDKSLALVAGPTGVGKTTLAQKIIEYLYAEKHDIDNPYMNAIYFEIPKQTKRNFDWEDIYIRLLRAMDEPFPDKKLALAKPISRDHGPRLTQQKIKRGSLRAEVEETIKKRGVKWIVMDEIAHLFKHASGKQDQNFDVLKSLANLTKTNIICVGTYECLYYIDWNAQLSRRSSLMEFSSYDLTTDHVEFAQSVSGLLAHLPCELDPEVMSDIEFFYLGCVGCVGLLKTWFEKALKNYLVSGTKLLSLNHFEATRPNNREVFRLIEEIQEGKGFFNAPSDDDIRARLGLKKGVQKPSVTAKKHSGRRVGERSPTRDKVLVDA